MNKIKFPKHILFIITLLLSINTFAKQNLIEELTTLQNKYKNLNKKYWKNKETMLKQRAYTDDNLKMLDNEIKTLYLKKNNITEEIYLKKEYLNNITLKKDEINDSQNEFKKNIFDIINKEETKINNMYPGMINKLIIKINKLKSIATNSDNNLAVIIKKLINYKNYIIKSGEEIKIFKRKIFIDEKKISTEALGLRIGFVDNIYSSKDSPGFLIRTENISGIYYKWITKLPSKIKNEITKVINKTISLKKSKLIDIPIDINQSGNKLKELRETDSGNIFLSMYEYFKAGGITMYPLGGIAILALFLIIERLLFFNKNYKKTNEEIEKIMTYLNNNDNKNAKIFCKNNTNPITKIILPIIEKSNSNRKTIEKIINEVLANEVPLLNKKLSTLSILAAIAPLLGLLGTVSGMITLFNVITVYGTSNPKILAGGISIALITTQTGLSIAIIIMFIHHYLVRKKNNILNLIELHTIKLLNKFYPN